MAHSINTGSFQSCQHTGNDHFALILPIQCDLYIAYYGLSGSHVKAKLN